ncbi:MAG: hypothetical protein HC875_27115 [Anaerolineales bacterium]|nr:hypothetical protein [Anaerolineales bacterium]
MKLPPAPRSPAPLLKLGQAALAFVLVIIPWFSYLLVNFNEIERYGPVLGTVAPLLRGDGSDRTVEQIFAFISGGQSPAPAHIDQQHYSVWQLISGFFTTFWINPVIPSVALNGFVIVMTGIAIVALFGLVKWPRRLRLFNGSDQPASSLLASSPPRPLRVVSLLLLHCLLSLPFMAVRLFGARDALEAVQGRHVLFLAGPALAILVVWGVQRVTGQVSSMMAESRSFIGSSRITHHASRITFYGLTGLLLAGSVLQLISLWTGYPPLLPVRTPPVPQAATPPPPITLPGGAVLMKASATPVEPGWLNALIPTLPVLRVVVLWQGGAEPAPEDYQMELALLDSQGQVRASWLGYQTQARYPTRVWEAGDTIRDEGWLPLEGLDASRGDYQIRWRILGENGPVLDWQTLSTYTLTATAQPQANESAQWLLWHDGQTVRHPPLLRERETAQFTLTNLQSPISNLYLIGPDHLPRPPVSLGETWANFIIGPDWPAGEYRWQSDGQVVLRVAESGRNFQIPPFSHPLEANFAGQINLLGYDLPTRRVQPGEGLPITLYWQGLRWMGEDFVIFNRLLDNAGMSWGGYDRRAKENYSTLYWAPGEIVSDGFAVPIDPTTPPGVYTVSLGWYRRVGEQADSLPILDPASGEPNGLTAVTIGPVKVGGPPPGIPVVVAAPRIEVGAVLGEQIKLLGFDLTSQPAGKLQESAANLPIFHTSALLHLTLYWQALTAVQTNYTVFAHVRDAGGQTVAQKDTPPAGGAYPTSLWDAGEIIKDEIIIPLEDVRADEYEVVVGMYDFDTGARLSVQGTIDNGVVLQRIEVTAR